MVVVELGLIVPAVLLRVKGTVLAVAVVVILGTKRGAIPAEYRGQGRRVLWRCGARILRVPR